MKLLHFGALCLYLTSMVASAPPSSPLNDLILRDTQTSPLESYYSLEKRKGGGGGKGGGGSSSSGGKSGSSSSGSSGSSGSSSGGGARPQSFSPSSNVGGRTRQGSGTPKQYGDRYAGGAVVPFSAGARSPSRGIAPYALPITALAFFPGIFLYSSLWAYPYGHYYWNDNGRNRTSNVTCVCQRYQVCGCDPTDNSTFLNQAVANGTGGAPVNTSLVRTVTFDNGTTGTYINGSLANGTTASGGTDPSNSSEVSAGVKLMMAYGGYWVTVATVVMGMWLAA